MRFRNPTVAVLALAIPLTWVLARSLPQTPSSVDRPCSVDGQATHACGGHAQADLSARDRARGGDPQAGPREAVVETPAPQPLASPPPARAPLALRTTDSRLDLEAGEHSAGDVLERWAATEGVSLILDPQVSAIRLVTQACRLDRPALRSLLEAHDVVLVRRDGLLHAVQRRNLGVRFGPPWDLVDDATPVDPDALVTRVIQVRHGGGNAIFATVRGLLTRDTNRIGNLLYVQGSEQLVICDFARNVRYYEQTIRALDQPAVAPAGAAD